MMKWTKCAIRFLRISRPGVRVPSIAPNNENPNLFSIGEGFGFFVSSESKMPRLRSNESPSGAFKRQRGLAQARWRGLAPTSVTPTRSHRKCRRIEEVKSRMDRKFSRIENLWPRDGSCPLPLRSKRIFNKCFRIVKTQK